MPKLGISGLGIFSQYLSTNELLIYRDLAVEYFGATPTSKVKWRKSVENDSIGTRGASHAIIQFRSDIAADLGCAVVENYWQESVRKFGPPLMGGGMPTQRLRNHFRAMSAALVESNFLEGCLLGRFSSEITWQSQPMRERVSIVFHQCVTAIEHVIQEAKVARELNQSLDARKMANFLLNSWEGAVLRAKVDGNDEALQAFEFNAFSLFHVF